MEYQILENDNDNINYTEEDEGEQIKKYCKGE